MPRNMSFAITTEQIKNRTKTVTRRDGWIDLKQGEIINAVEKCMGLKKGEKMKVLCQFKVIKVTREKLLFITPDEVLKEGFTNTTQVQFIDMFCKSHKGLHPYSLITRIEFEYINN